MSKKGYFGKPISCHNLCNIKFGNGSQTITYCTNKSFLAVHSLCAEGEVKLRVFCEIESEI